MNIYHIDIIASVPGTMVALHSPLALSTSPPMQSLLNLGPYKLLLMLTVSSSTGSIYPQLVRKNTFALIFDEAVGRVAEIPSDYTLVRGIIERGKGYFAFSEGAGVVRGYSLSFDDECSFAGNGLLKNGSDSADATLFAETTNVCAEKFCTDCDLVPSSSIVHAKGGEIFFQQNLFSTLVGKMKILLIDKSIFNNEISSVLNDTSYTLKISNNSITIDLLLNPLPSSFSITLFARYPSSYPNPIKSSDLKKSCKQNLTLTYYPPKVLSGGLNVTTETVTKTVAALTSYGTVALVAASPTSAFFLLKLVSTLSYLPYLNGPVLERLNLVLKATAATRSFLGEKIQAAIDSSINPVVCARELTLPIKEFDTSCHLLSNYGADSVGLLITLVVACLIRLALYVVTRRQERISKVDSDESADKDIDNDKSVGQLDQSSKNELENDSTLKRKPSLITKVVTAINDLYGWSYFWQNIDAVAMECMLLCFLHLFFAGDVRPSNVIGVFVSIAHFVCFGLLLYFYFKSSMIAYRNAMKERSHSANKSSLSALDPLPETQSTGRSENPQPTPIRSQTFQAPSPATPPQTTPPVLAPQPATFLYAYTPLPALPTLLTSFYPPISLLRTFFLPLTLSTLTSSTHPYPQLVLTLILEVTYLIYLICERRLRSCGEWVLESAKVTVCACVVVGKLVACAESVEERVRQVWIGGGLAWVVIGFLVIGLVYVIVTSLMAVFESIKEYLKKRKAQGQSSKRPTELTSIVPPTKDPSSKLPPEPSSALLPPSRTQLSSLPSATKVSSRKLKSNSPWGSENMDLSDVER